MRLNVAAILREDAMLRREEEKRARKVQEYEQALHDSSSFDEYVAWIKLAIGFSHLISPWS